MNHHEPNHIELYFYREGMTVLYYIVDYKDNDVVIQINAAEAVENIVPRDTLTEQIDFKPHHAANYSIFQGRPDFSSQLRL